MNTKQTRIINGLIRFLIETNHDKQNIKIDNINEITAGWETELYSFILEYTKDKKVKSEKLVIRIYPGDFAENKLSNEFFIYTNLSKQNYPVPKIHYMTTDKQYIGRPFLIMDWITGGTLDDRLNLHFKETMLIFCKLFVDLHRLDWQPFVRKLNSKKTLIPTIDLHIDALEKRVKINNLNELLPIVHWLKDERKKIENEYLAIGHYDFHTFNILLDEKGSLFVIDWPSAKVNDFRFDLAWTLVLYNAYSNRESRDLLFETYQEVAGKQIDHISFFEVAGILRRLCDILITFKANAESTGLRDGVVKMIKESIDHVENLNSHLEELSGIRIREIDELVLEVRNE